MRWGVPEGTRDADGELIHDDIVMADALLAEADLLEWHVHTPTFVIPPKDPLEAMSRFLVSGAPAASSKLCPGWLNCRKP